MTTTWTFDETDERLLAAFAFWNRRGYISLTIKQFQVALDAEPAMDVSVEEAVRSAIEHGLIEQIAAQSYRQTEVFLETTYGFDALGENLFRNCRDKFGLI